MPRVQPPRRQTRDVLRLVALVVDDGNALHAYTPLRGPMVVLVVVMVASGAYPRRCEGSPPTACVPLPLRGKDHASTGPRCS